MQEILWQPSVYLLGAGSIPPSPKDMTTGMSPDIARCPLGTEISQLENHYTGLFMQTKAFPNMSSKDQKHHSPLRILGSSDSRAPPQTYSNQNLQGGDSNPCFNNHPAASDTPWSLRSPGLNFQLFSSFATCTLYRGEGEKEKERKQIMSVLPQLQRLFRLPLRNVCWMKTAQKEVSKL